MKTGFEDMHPAQLIDMRERLNYEIYVRKCKKQCFANHHSDQMVCGYCNLTWDMNDHEPPNCKIVKL